MHVDRYVHELARVDEDDLEDVELGEQPTPSVLQARRSTREHRPSVSYPDSDYILLTAEG